MDRCCALNPSPRTQRRLNGLQLPLNFQQIIGWFVFIATGSLNFTILIEIQFDELKTVSLIVFTVLYVCHIISHITASLIDPSENELRKLEVYNVPEFDRQVHAHVIENGRCHLCNINTSSRKTKHCSICNKCVECFDHHCKWLNNCVGRRNYVAFISCVTTALMISTFTSSLCAADVVIFFTNPIYLSTEAQNFINCNSNTAYCRSSITFLVFLIFFFVIASAIGCALLHLCCFHAYISVLGVSTYEYVVRSGETEAPSFKSMPCCRLNISKKLYVVKKPKDNSKSPENLENVFSPTRLDVANPSEPNVFNFISILIAKKVFMYDKNKIHPNEENNS